MKLKVNDIEEFCELIKAVNKIVPDAKFIVDENGCQVKVINDSQTIRAFFSSQSLESEESVEFCFKDIMNLKQSLEMISNIEDENFAELDFNGTFISYKNNVKFKLKVVKEDIIERYITKDLKTKLEKVFKFMFELEKMKQVLQCVNIVSNSDSKVYISENNGKVIAEIDDKTNKMANSVGIPISDELDGTIESPIPLMIENFQAFTTLGVADEIEVTFTDKNVFEVRSEYESIKMYLITTILKK